MEPNHKLALYVSYYLARFNNEALNNLGYTTWNTAFSDIGQRLKVKSHSVKNWRDEFDPLFGHRAGWYQRPLSPSRVKVAQALENLEEIQIREIVNDILSGKLGTEVEEKEQLLAIISEDKGYSNTRFILRAPTGRAAEELFIKHHSLTSEPFGGELIDCRDLGCGYDFKIISEDDERYIEVKGLSKASGGILFTDKEWRTAKEGSDRYFLCIVKNIPENPKIYFIKNPFKELKAKKNIFTAIQINWSINQNQLAKIDD